MGFVLLFFVMSAFAEICGPEEFYGDLERIVAELQPQTTVKIDLETKAPNDGLVNFEMTKEFAPPTQERFDQVVKSLSSEKALNELDYLLEVKRNPALNIVIQASSTEPDAEGKFKMVTSTWIDNFKTLTSKQSVMNCTDKKTSSHWTQACAIDLNDPATVKYVSSGHREMGCELSLGKKIVCTTRFSAHPKTLDLPFLIRPIAKKVAGTSDLSSSQLAYKTIQRSLGLILALHEFADAGGVHNKENIEKAANAARSSVFNHDVDAYMKTLPTSAKSDVAPIHYVKKDRSVNAP